MSAALLILGFLLVVGGVALLTIPGAVIAAGALLLVAGADLGRRP